MTSYSREFLVQADRYKRMQRWNWKLIPLLLGSHITLFHCLTINLNRWMVSSSLIYKDKLGTVCMPIVIISMMHYWGQKTAVQKSLIFLILIYDSDSYLTFDPAERNGRDPRHRLRWMTLRSAQLLSPDRQIHTSFSLPRHKQIPQVSVYTCKSYAVSNFTWHNTR